MKQKQSRRIGQRRLQRRNKQISAKADAEVTLLDLVVGAAEDTLTEHELALQTIDTTLTSVNTTLTDHDSRLTTLEPPL